MTTLIDHLATDRLRGARLVLAYATGVIAGTLLAVVAVLALTG